MQDNTNTSLNEVSERIQLIGINRLGDPWYCKIHLILKLLIGNYRISRKYGSHRSLAIKFAFRYTVVFIDEKFAERIFK